MLGLVASCYLLLTRVLTTHYPLPTTHYSLVTTHRGGRIGHGHRQRVGGRGPLAPHLIRVRVGVRVGVGVRARARARARVRVRVRVRVRTRARLRLRVRSTRAAPGSPRA